jgi:hypothetical protein
VLVYGDGLVFGDAQVYGNALVCGDAQVYGDAQVKRNHTKPVWTLNLGKHIITVDDGYLNIGCKTLSIEEWVEKFKEIGEKEGYIEEEIERYEKVINLIKEITK